MANDYFINDSFLFSKELAALFGTDWAIDFLIPAIIEIRQHKSYLRRLTALQACAMMATVVDADASRSEMLPLVLEMATDGVSIKWYLVFHSLWPSLAYTHAVIFIFIVASRFRIFVSMLPRSSNQSRKETVSCSLQGFNGNRKKILKEP